MVVNSVEFNPHRRPGRSAQHMHIWVTACCS